MSQQTPDENNQFITQQSGIQQLVENTTFEGAMLAIQGDGNTQIHGKNLVFHNTEILQIDFEILKTYELNEASPYKGLKKFEPEDKNIFFGRDQLIISLVQGLEQTNLILLLGASGSGKSSVVRAGLIPLLSKKWGTKFVKLIFNPDKDPFESLYGALLSKYKQSEAEIARGGKAETLIQVIKQLKQPDEYWFILLDQFEELFTISKSEKSELFIKALLQLHENLDKTKQDSIKIMATMRADFLDKLSPYPKLLQVTDKHRPMIGEMQPDELRLAIEQPAAHYGVMFETGLVEQIIKEVQGQAGYLPLLQYALNLLWEEEIRTKSILGRILKIDIYRQLGGVRGALEKRVGAFYEALEEPEKQATQRIFLKLVDIGEDTASGSEWKPVRRRALKSEFNELEEQVLMRLVNANLLVSAHQPESNKPTIDIAHEILLTTWTTLNTWIKDNRQAIALRNRLNDDVAHWQQKNKAEDELWTGSKLERVLELRKDPNFHLVLGGFSEASNQFIDASLGLRDKQLRRIRLVAVGGLTLAALASATSIFAVYQLQQSKRQRVEELAITAKTLLSTNPTDALIIAISTLRLSRSLLISFPNRPIPASVQDSLLSAVQRSHEENRLQAHQGVVYSVVISDDGKTIVTGGYDGMVRLWNRNGQPIGKPFRAEQTMLRSLAISGDGQTIVTGAYHDGTVRLWNHNGQPIGKPFQAHKGWVKSIALSRDGQTIVTGGDGTLGLWSRNGQLIKPLQVHGYGLWDAVAINKDGQTIVTGGGDGTVRLWNRNGQPIGKPFQGHRGGVLSVAVSDDGQTIVSGGSDGKVFLWNRNGQSIAQPFEGHLKPVWSVAINSDGKTIVSGGEDATVRVWNRNGQPVAEPFVGHRGTVVSLAISNDGQTIVSGGEDGTVRLWNPKPLLITQPIASVKGKVSSATINNDGQTIVSGGPNGIVRLWNRNGQPIGKPFQAARWVGSVAINNDGQTIVTGGGDGTVRLWNRNGQPIGKPFQGHRGSVWSVAVSDDGQTIVSGGEDDTVRLWKRNGQPIGEAFKAAQGRVRVKSVALSRDGQTIVAGEYNTVRLWNRNGQPIGKPFQGHRGGVLSVGISSDGQTIVSSGLDYSVRLWNRNGQAIGEPFLSWYQENYVAISSDGKTIIILGRVDYYGYSLVSLVDTSIDSWLKLGCQRLRHHSVLSNPETTVALEAKAMCEQYWR